MKKIIFCLFSLCLVCLQTVSQETVKVGGLNYILDSSDNTAIVGRNCEAKGAITIPASITYKGQVYEVVEIGKLAFAYPKDGHKKRPLNENLTSITLSEGLKTIGESAFASCKSILTIKIPNSVKTIEDDAFVSSGLMSVTFGTGLKKIGSYAFCKTSIKKVIIPPQSGPAKTKFSWVMLGVGGQRS